MHQQTQTKIGNTMCACGAEVNFQTVFCYKFNFCFSWTTQKCNKFIGLSSVTFFNYDLVIIARHLFTFHILTTMDVGQTSHFKQQWSPLSPSQGTGKTKFSFFRHTRASYICIVSSNGKVVFLYLKRWAQQSEVNIQKKFEVSHRWLLATKPSQFIIVGLWYELILAVRTKIIVIVYDHIGSVFLTSKK